MSEPTAKKISAEIIELLKVRGINIESVFLTSENDIYFRLCQCGKSGLSQSEIELQAEAKYIARLIDDAFRSLNTFIKIGSFARFRASKILSVGYYQDAEKQIHVITVYLDDPETSEATVILNFGFLADASKTLTGEIPQL